MADAEETPEAPGSNQTDCNGAAVREDAPDEGPAAAADGGEEGKDGMEQMAVDEVEDVDDPDIAEQTQTDSVPAGDTQAETLDSEPDQTKLTQLPIAKIKKIMKFDPEVTMANQDAVFLVAKATELFIEAFTRQAGHLTVRSKRKTVQKRDVEAIVDTEMFSFLEGTLETV